MQNESMNDAQMLAMEGNEVIYGPIMVLLALSAVVITIVIIVKWTQKRRADKAQLQESLTK